MKTSRFVILHHLAPTGEHWDFMLEQENALATWQLVSEPVNRGSCPIECVRIHDHRKHYLTFQGPVSGGRGIVTRIDQGRYELLAIDETTWTFRLSGIRLTGDFCLVTAPPSATRWTLVTT